jgi:hypothetical protein
VTSLNSNILLLGTTVRAKHIPTRGLLGAIACDSQRNVFGLTARHVLANKIGSHVFDEFGRLLGTEILLDQISSGPQPMINSIGIFAISSDVAVSASCDQITKSAPPAEMKNLIGRPVRKLDYRGWQGATVSQVFGSIQLVPPTGEAQPKYYDAVEIEPNDPESFAASGDAGALVLTDVDEPVGLLMAGSDRRYFLAPISDFLASKQLHLLSSLEAFERELGRPMINPIEILRTLGLRSKLAQNSFRPKSALAKALGED